VSTRAADHVSTFYGARERKRRRREAAEAEERARDIKEGRAIGAKWL